VPIWPFSTCPIAVANDCAMFPAPPVWFALPAAEQKKKGKKLVNFSFSRVEANSRTYTGRARQVAANAKLMMDGIHKAIKMAEHELIHQKNNHA
jgi:hypothetical protein